MPISTEYRERETWHEDRVTKYAMTMRPFVIAELRQYIAAVNRRANRSIGRNANIITLTTAIYGTLWLWLQPSNVERFVFIGLVLWSYVVFQYACLLAMRRLARHLYEDAIPNWIPRNSLDLIMWYGWSRPWPTDPLSSLDVFVERRLYDTLTRIIKEQPHCTHSLPALTAAIIDRLFIAWYYTYIHRLSLFSVK